MFADAHTQGFEAAAEQIGKDTRVYDFTTALLEAFNDVNVLKSYQRGEKIFRQVIEIV